MGNATCETVLEILVQMLLACVQTSSANDSLLKHKVISAWIPVLKRWASIESTASEQTFCCICQLMLDTEKKELISEAFVQEFIDCGGPDVTVEMLHTFMEYKRGGAVMGAFCMLLPLCKIQWGQKWLRKNYHKIVECYQFFDSTTELLDFPSTTIMRVRMIWQHFKQTFNTIQATESKKHEAELLAEEEREKAKREKKTERKKRKEQKKGQRLKGDISSPNTSVEDVDDTEKETFHPIIKVSDKEPNWNTTDSKRTDFEKVLSKKELKISKKKAQVSDSDKNEKTEINLTKVKNLNKDDEDETFMNFRPNRGKPPGVKNKGTTKIKPSDLPWRNLKKPVGNTSPGKEFPKLCKEKFATMMKEVHDENEKMLERKPKFTKEDNIPNSSEDTGNTKRPNQSYKNIAIRRKCLLQAENKREEAQSISDKHIKTVHPVASNLKNTIVTQSDNKRNRANQVKEPETNTLDEEEYFNKIFGSISTILHEMPSPEIKTNASKESINTTEVAICKTSPVNAEKRSKLSNEAPHFDMRNEILGGIVTDVLAMQEGPGNDVQHTVPVSDTICCGTQSKSLSTAQNEKQAQDNGIAYLKDDEENTFSEQHRKNHENSDIPDIPISNQSTTDPFIGSLSSIWDISPVKQNAHDVSQLGIPIENISPATKVNKKRSRATSTASRELFKMPVDLSPLDQVTRMNQENSVRSKFQRFMHHKTDQDHQEIYGISNLEDDVGIESEDTPVISGKSLELNITTDGSSADPTKSVRENSGYEFLSESRLKSTGSIKSDGSVSLRSVKEEQNVTTDSTDIGFGYFSSSANASYDSENEPKNLVIKEENPDVIGIRADFKQTLISPSLSNHAPSPSCITPNATVGVGLNRPFAESNQCVRRQRLSDVDESENCRKNKFGVIGEPCPIQTIDGEGPANQVRGSFEDFSRLKPGDGDRLLDEEDTERELFGSRSHWREPSYFGYGYLDGLSQVMSAQKDLTQTDNLEKVYQRYPVFGQGMEYETFKKRRIEEQWQQRQLNVQYNKISGGEPVRVDHRKASTLIPQHLLDSSFESEPGELSVRNQPNQFRPPEKVNSFFGIPREHQQPSGQVIEKEYELFPLQQVPNFEPKDMCFPQPGVPVIGNQHGANLVPGQHGHQPKPPAFNSDSAQTGQGDSYYYHDARRQFVAHSGYYGGQVKPEIAKSRSAPFLNSAGAVFDAQKYAQSFTQGTAQSFTLGTADYLSSDSDRSSLTSATISTINSFKSANELVCSRSDVSLSSERLADSFIIGKGFVRVSIYFNFFIK